MRTTIDPLPSETIITDENYFEKQLKSPEIVIRAYSRWRTFIQENLLYLSKEEPMSVAYEPQAATPTTSSFTWDQVDQVGETKKTIFILSSQPLL